MKALFVPLMTKHYNAFLDGSKTEELRLYGKRWNEKTCIIGRPIILSKGYGKQNRMIGTISGFKTQHDSLISFEERKDLWDIYKRFDIYIARISIADLKPWKETNE